MNRIEICFTPALLDQYDFEESVVVVTDVFRASTTMCTAFANGVQAIIPVATEAEALSYKSMGYLVGAEQATERCEFADFGNSPAEYSVQRVSGKMLVMTTSNGTKAIKGAQNCHKLLIGAFVNLQALVQRIKDIDRDVLIVCAGSGGRICLEDSLFSGALASALLAEDGFESASDGTRIAVALWHQANRDFSGFLMRSEHAKRLIEHGFRSDLNYCLRKSIIGIVPELKGDKLVVVKGRV
ncbi:MAG: 2-phosphosulfolactate phosphatase [Bacteroidales bacterium]|nr:2-phosphosulfolactate phosphatase [Candidatus Liminaster caballi]